MSGKKNDPAAAAVIHGTGKTYTVHLRAADISRPGQLFADALVVCPSYRGTPPLPAGFHCNIVAVPGKVYIPGLRVCHSVAVSYGMADQDTVTFSSLSGKTGVLSVRREIVTVSGKIIERQDFPPVCLPPRLEPSEALAYFSALLILELPLPCDSNPQSARI